MSNKPIGSLAAAAAVAFAIACGAARGEPKPEDGKTIAIQVEYHRAGGMQVTFFDDVKPETRAEFLKAGLESYVRLFKPATNYLATAYDAAGKNLGGQMIYVHDREKVMTVELYQQGR